MSPIRPTADLIGRRIKALRQRRGLTQDDLARLFGLKDRQSVSAIEHGVRRARVDELVLLSETLGEPLDYFTDPFSLVGEGRFCWRRDDVGAERLEAYERKVGAWIAAFRALAPRVDREPPLMRRSLVGLTRDARPDDAMRAGERFATEFDLGDVPAERLAEAMQDELGILVLMVDAEKGISGAACRLPELDAVLVARGELPGRRHFDLAHELFHLLTWDEMPPAHAESDADTGGNRVERLANSFAGALLMPERVLGRGGWADLDAVNLVSRLNAVADELKVTSSALRWRLVALGELSKQDAVALPGSALHNNGRDVTGPVPPLFSRRFAEVVLLALEGGHVSTRRLSSLLDIDIGGIESLLVSHGLPHRVDELGET